MPPTERLLLRRSLANSAGNWLTRAQMLTNAIRQRSSGCAKKQISSSRAPTAIWNRSRVVTSTCRNGSSLRNTPCVWRTRGQSRKDLLQVLVVQMIRFPIGIIASRMCAASS